MHPRSSPGLPTLTDHSFPTPSESKLPFSWPKTSSRVTKEAEGDSQSLLIWCPPAVGEGNGNPLQYSCLENLKGRGAWWAAVHGVAGSWTWLSDFTFTFHFHALEKEMATHSSVFAWRIPGMAEPGGLPSLGSHRVGHDWSDLAAAAAIVLLQALGKQRQTFLPS